MTAINDGVLKFKLLDGKSAETSGGLLIMMPPESADDFMKELENEYGQKSWVVGEVSKGQRNAVLSAKPDVIEVTGMHIQ